MLLASRSMSARVESADSIIGRMHNAAALYMDYVQEYRADLYVKAQLDIIKKNIGFRYIPGLFKVEKDANRYILETYSELHYTAPNIYDEKIKAYTGTLPDVREIPGISEYLNINIYAPYLVGQQLLSPLAPNSNKYYRYAIDSVSSDREQRTEYHIRFIPRNKSHLLVEGNMVVTEGAWSIREFCFKGKADLLDFKCHIFMGEVGTDKEYLPIKNNIEACFAFFYNVLEGYYEANLTYKEIHFRKKETEKKKTKTNYNLTDSYSLQCDREAYKKDPTLLDSLRPQPLTESEIHIYNRYKDRDSLPLTEIDSVEVRRKKRWSAVGDFFISDSKWNLNDNMTLRNSPFMSPLMFSHSKTNGTAYRQDIKLSLLPRENQSLYIGTRLGYNFTNREFYWSGNTELHYWPEHQGMLRLNVGNGNRIGNSRIIDKLKELPADTIIDFDKLNYDLFLDLNFEISNRLEIVNGLTTTLGFIYHRRTPAEHPDDSFRQIDLPTNIQEGIWKNLRPEFRSFAPRIRVEWTPGQYYYMNGRKKINLHSRYPTFSVDWERGIKGVFKSDTKYERIEFDMQHHIRTGLLSHIYYRVGCGMFTKQDETFFVDYANFRKSNLPENWNDEIGGVFQALNGRWYNASPYYVRGHITYDAPFLLMRHLLKYTGHVQNERLYLNMLAMDHLGPYFEVGYGIGTFVFDMGLFLSLEDFKRVGFGYKITFELFSK